MPFNTQKRSKLAASRKRDEKGHFIPKHSQDIKVTQKNSGPANVISNFLKTGQADEDTLINVKVHNPLSRIARLLEDIKAKQATTVSMRFTIPLIALPVVFFLAFSLGKAQSNCMEFYTSKIGTLEIINVESPKEPNFLEKVYKFIPFVNFQTGLEEKSQVLLIDRLDQTLLLMDPSGSDINNFNAQKVIASGTYSSCTQTMTLDSSKNIRIYPL